MDFRDTVRRWGSGRVPPLAVAIILVAAVFRFYGLAEQPLWYDELISIDLAMYEGGVRAIWDVTSTKFYPHPPLFILILRFLFNGSAPSEFLARFPSVFVSLLAFPIFYRFLAAVANRKLATVALMFLALSPYHIYYAQEARPYALMFTLVVLTLWVLHKALSRDGVAWWFAHALCILVLLYLHYFNWCVVGGEVLYMLLSWRRHKRHLAAYALSLTPVLLAVPLLANLFHASQRLGHILVLNAVPVSISFSSTWMTLVAGEARYVPHWLRLSGLIAYGVLAVVGMGGLANRKRNLLILVLSMISVPVVFVFILLKAVGHIVPPYEERQFMVILPFVLILAASGVVYWPLVRRSRLAGMVSTILLVALLTTLLGGNLVALSRYYGNWDKNLDIRVIEYLESEVQPGDILICNSVSIAENIRFHWDSDVPVTIVSLPRYREGEWLFSEELSVVPEHPIEWNFSLEDTLAHSRVWLISQSGFSSTELDTAVLDLVAPAHSEQFGPFSVYLLVP